MTAAQVADFPKRRAPAAAPVHKLRVFEQVRRLICDGEVRRSAMIVVQYLAEITDRKTGLATVELNTIADRTGYSRGEAGKAIKELVDAGLVERVPRRKGKRCLATAFRLVDPSSERRRPGRREATTPSPTGDTSRAFVKSHPNILNPGGLAPPRENHRREMPVDSVPSAEPPPAHQEDEAAVTAKENWTEHAEWLAREGRYRRYGPGPGEAYRLARDDLDRWRGDKGDQAILEAIRRAKALGLSGDNLIDFLASTHPAKRQRSRSRPLDGHEDIIATIARVAARVSEP